MTELSLEGLSNKIETIASAINTFEANQKQFFAKASKATDDNIDKEKEQAKKAKQAKKLAAVKAAMDEEDDDKKEAAIKAAMDEDNDDHDKTIAKKGMTEEEKEKEAQIASILDEKRQEITNKIMTANKIINPNQLPEIEARLKVASITELNKEWTTLEPFVANIPQGLSQSSQEQVIPFFASGVANPADIDKSQLNASSPDSEFAKFTTQELLEMSQ